MSYTEISDAALTEDQTPVTARLLARFIANHVAVNVQPLNAPNSGFGMFLTSAAWFVLFTYRLRLPARLVGGGGTRLSAQFELHTAGGATTKEYEFRLVVDDGVTEWTGPSTTVETTSPTTNVNLETMTVDMQLAAGVGADLRIECRELTWVSSTAADAYWTDEEWFASAPFGPATGGKSFLQQLGD